MGNQGGNVSRDKRWLRFYAAFPPNSQKTLALPTFLGEGDWAIKLKLVQ